MIIELFVFLLAWIILGSILSLIISVPLLISVPLSILLLIVYDYMARPESELTEGRE